VVLDYGDVERAVVGLQDSLCHEELLRPLERAGAGLDIGLSPEDLVLGQD
jgi:hypothetical protein